MVNMNYHPEISATDFNEMRAQYKDYLRSKNFNDEDIEFFLSEFDIARWKEDYEWIYNKMTAIGVKII